MKIKAVCFGEVLWDVFPDNARIGGAPLNVASRLSATGIQTELISKVGSDQKGKEILDYLKSNNVGTENIGTDSIYPTGMVNVSLNASGAATYEIAYPAAWDKIVVSKYSLDAVKKADVFIFGSLVCRDEAGQKALFELLPEAKYRIFDINLRPPFYEKEVLVKLMDQADFIKFNDEELFEISAMMGSPYNSLEQNILFISEQTNTQSICVTKGRHGAVLLKEGNLFYNSGYQIRVKDTVGAGDSFLASLVAKLLTKEKPQAALDYACAVGAMVAGSEGANPKLETEKIKKFMFPLKF